jgi:hypothetical protein
LKTIHQSLFLHKVKSSLCKKLACPKLEKGARCSKSDSRTLKTSQTSSYERKLTLRQNSCLGTQVFSRRCGF